MSLRSPAVDEMALTLALPRVRHSRMLLAGIQAELGLDPRQKHSWVTVVGGASLHLRHFHLSEASEAHETLRGEIRFTV
jgi:hypothetical protein